jgi:hypothetical protein
VNSFNVPHTTRRLAEEIGRLTCAKIRQQRAKNSPTLCDFVNVHNLDVTPATARDSKLIFCFSDAYGALT